MGNVALVEGFSLVYHRLRSTPLGTACLVLCLALHIAPKRIALSAKHLAWMHLPPAPILAITHRNPWSGCGLILVSSVPAMGEAPTIHTGTYRDVHTLDQTSRFYLKICFVHYLGS